MPKKTKKTETISFVIEGQEKSFNIATTEDAPKEDAPKARKPKEAKEPRDRKFCLTSYVDRNALLQFLKRSEWVQHWAMTTHDRDILEDGSLKGEHTHVLLYTFNAKTASSVRKLFDRYSKEIYKNTTTEAQNTLCQICFDMPTQWRYLIHADNPEKAQYDINERMCDSFDYWNKLEISAGMNDSSDNYGLAILKDYMNGVHPLEMAHRYGKEYIYHLSHYQKFGLEVAKADGRPFVNVLNLREMMELCLEGSPLKDDTINAFWVVYDFIITQINQNYNSKINFYLTEKEN